MSCRSSAATSTSAASSGDAADRVDLLPIAAHGIGRALGPSEFNPHVPSPLEITAPPPFAGHAIQTQGNDHLKHFDSLMNPIQSEGGAGLDPASLRGAGGGRARA